MTAEVAGVRTPRPVTPLGLAAAALDRVLGRLTGDPLADAEVLADLRTAALLVSGLDGYVERCTSPESAALALVSARTATKDWDARPVGRERAPLEQEMLSGHLEGVFLRFLVSALRATRVLEIGMFTGYAALAMAEALPDGGRLVTCEVDAFVAGFARDGFEGSAAGARIDIRVGPALDTLRTLAAGGEAFDLIFIDADKPGYAAYLEEILGGGLLAPGGLVAVDNTLLQGQPWTGPDTDNGRAIAAFNEAVAADPRVEQVLLPVRDGLTLIRRVGP